MLTNNRFKKNKIKLCLLDFYVQIDKIFIICINRANFNVI